MANKKIIQHLKGDIKTFKKEAEEDKKLIKQLKKKKTKKKVAVKKAPARVKVKKVMREFEAGELHSGSKMGPLVTNPKQAIAIALSEGRKVKSKRKKVQKKRK